MSPGRLVAGLSIIAVGVLLLLDGAGVLDAGPVIGDWWPLTLVALGVFRLAADPTARTGSVILIVIGAVLLAGNLAVFSTLWSFLAPVALIVVGVVLLRSRPDGSLDRGGSRIGASAVLSRRVVTPVAAITGGEVTVVLGSMDLDLTAVPVEADLRLSATVLLGALNILVPAGWKVTLKGAPILGGWDDTTRRDAVTMGGPELTVDALVVLGGIEVRHPERWG